MIILVFFLSYWLGLSLRYSVIIFLLLAIILLTFAFKRFKKKVFLIALVFFLGGFGTSFIKFTHTQVTYEGVVYEAKDNYFLFSSKLERLYVYSKGHDYEVGDWLSIKGYKTDLSFSSLESSFDFTSYLNKKGVYKALSSQSISYKFKNPLRIRNKRNAFLNHFNEEQKALIGSLLFSSYDESETTTTLKNLHLTRLLSCGGFYIYFFLSILTYIYSFFVKEKWAHLLALLSLFPYFIFTWFKFSVLRIIVMSLLNFLNQYVFKTKLHHLTIIGISGLFFLFLDFHLGYQDSFILGYLIALLTYLLRGVTRYYRRIYQKPITSLYLLLFFLPFETRFYNSISPFSFILTLLLSPLFYLIGLLSLLCFYGLPIYSWLSGPISLAINIASFFNYFLPLIYVTPFNDYLLVLYEMAYFIYLYYHILDFKIFTIPLLTFIISSLLVMILPINIYLYDEVNFINVGQGDSCLIRHFDYTILIDTGGSTSIDVATSSLIPYFKKKHIYDIDLLITTHDDYDHSGAKTSLMKHFTVRKYLYLDEQFPYTIGGITFTNYNHHIDENSDDENAQSLVLGFNFMELKFLIMGDAPIAIEEKIIEEYPHLDCDILKVGHHGSDTSTCNKFLETVTPSEAVISVGKNNKYGHPKDKVINLLKKHHIKIKRTDQNGTITYKKVVDYFKLIRQTKYR